MKSFLVLLFFSFSTQALIASPEYTCVLKNQIGVQKHYQCTFPTLPKKLELLELTGPIDETAYYHGLFLAKETRDGLIEGIESKKNQLLSTLSENERASFVKISRCLVGQYDHSSSDEYKRMVKNQWRGLREGGVKDISLYQLKEAHYMVEMSIFFDGIDYLMDENRTSTYLKLFSTCGLELTGNPLKLLLKKMSSLLKSIKFGCTGIASTAAYNEDDSLILGRNFDTGLLGFFEMHPTILLHHPSKGHSYIGMAGAGLHYPGGISGFNEKGIALSLHELQTKEPTTNPHGPYSPEESVFSQGPSAASDITPFLSNRILMEASNIDEAYGLAQKYLGYGAWTIFVGDADDQEIASIELAGKTVRLARREKNSALAQSNHFLHPDVLKRAFTYSLNKEYETRARFDLVTQMLHQDQGEIDSQWFINTLAGHKDIFVGQRSFGKTITKAYTSMSHVMVPSKRQFWFSLSERLPATSSTFAGIQVDFNSGDKPYFKFIGFTKASNPELDNFPSWEKSLHYYSTAYSVYESGLENPEKISEAISLLDQAILLADQDGITELPYHFIRFKLRMKLLGLRFGKGEIPSVEIQSELRDDLEILLKKDQEGKDLVTMIPYERSLVYLWLARSYDLFQNTPQSLFYYGKTHEIHQELLYTFPSHSAFHELIGSYSTTQGFSTYTWDMAAKGPIHFGTVE